MAWGYEYCSIGHIRAFVQGMRLWRWESDTGHIVTSGGRVIHHDNEERVVRVRLRAERVLHSAQSN